MDSYDSAGFITIVERFELIRGDFSVVHALEEGMNAGIFFAPEVVSNCIGRLAYYFLISSSIYCVHESDTVGPSVTVPGIAPACSIDFKQWLFVSVRASKIQSLLEASFDTENLVRY